MDGVNHWKDYRNYEVSVWTLLDNYIATLKSGDPIHIASSSLPTPGLALAWPLARAQGLILNGKMTLNIDGTQNLTFDIPMYLYVNGEKKENPNWYNVVDGNVLTSMRKIKVIFDKWDNLGDADAMSASTFEFIILKVLEEHESDNLMCHIECEGLAFHELGKVGYKLSLTTLEFNDDYYNWSIATVGTNDEETGDIYDYATNAEKDLAEPKANIDYWMKKAGIPLAPVTLHNILLPEKMNPNKWYYLVKMVHSALDHDEDTTTPLAYDESFIDARVIYELSYPSDWNSDGNPINYVEAREKCRLVDLEESNLYNITQDLAEKFEVFCRYLYYYDNNYNIVGRLIVFYNNFLLENRSTTTLMYPNSASRISREMDSTDVSTKMFVRNVEADDIYAGLISIMDCKANKTREDYVMNFDYLHDIGTISEELYDAISKYEVDIRRLNDKIVPILELLKSLETLKTDVDAKVKTLENSISLDEERITESSALMNALDAADGNEDGYITIDYRNPDTLPLSKDTSNTRYDTYYVLFNLLKRCGVDPESVKLYKEYHSTSSSTFQYGLGFSKFKKPGTSTAMRTTNGLSLQGTSTGWQDYEFTYKGTIGYDGNNHVTTLPATDNNTGKIAYLAKTENYPSGYTIAVNLWLCYNPTTKKWEIKDSRPNDYTNKGTIGEKPDTKTLPSSGLKKGWFYKVITKGTYSSTAYECGDLIYYTGSSWAQLAKPSSVKVKDGFYLFKLETCSLKNGLKTRIYTCIRKGADNAATDYITKIRNVYFVTTNNATPDTLLIESATTDATDIKTYNILNKWSTFMSLPDDLTVARLIYTSSEITHSLDKKEYLALVGDISTDDTNINISTALQDIITATLTDEITGGIFEYDKDSGNLDKITNLFKTGKNGYYTTYSTLTYAGATKNNNTNFTTINNLVAELKSQATGKTYPDDIVSSYIIILNEYYHTNGNKTYSYTLKYVDSNGLPVTPSNTSRIYLIIPIFYLTEKAASTIPTPTKKNISSTKAVDVWTTTLPDKVKSALKYYSGYKIVTYADKTYYYGNTSAEDNSLRKAKNVTETETSTSVPEAGYIYATYRYNPHLYYEKIKTSWEKKLSQDKIDLQDYSARQDKLEELIEETKYKLYGNEKNDNINGLVGEKKDLISKFEYMMGAALRESYWQPEDEYLDYGEKHKEVLTLLWSGFDTSTAATYWQKNDDESFAYIGWDTCRYDEEDKLYYESSINETKVYYPCIDLTQVKINMKGKTKSFLEYYTEWCAGKDLDEPYSFFFYPSKTTIPPNESALDVRFCKYYVIGSTAKLLFARDNTGAIKPLLVLTEASNLADSELDNLKTTGRIGLLKEEEKNGNYILNYSKTNTYAIVSTDSALSGSINKALLTDTQLENLLVVYPRIIVPSLKLKTNTKDLTIHYKHSANDDDKNDIALKKFEDYYVLTKTYYENTISETNDYLIHKYNDLENYMNIDTLNNETKFISVYSITLKPECVFKYITLGGNPLTLNTLNFRCYFALSNADVDIFLDAKKIMKENAYPKVSYEIEVSLWSKTLLEHLYRLLAQIVMINDTDLKLLNTFGYISLVELDLDHLENDTVEVKNYKTKFEDLFSKIVAETEEMHKNSFNIGMAGAMVTGAGVDATITPDGFDKTISNKTNQDILKAFLDEYFDGAEIVQKTLKSMWDDAGAIMSDAARSLGSVIGLTSKNASILASFREDIVSALSPAIYTGDTPPTNFKPGDIWMNNGIIEVATGYGGDGKGGFTRTYDGKLAEISGHSFGMNADTGEIDIINETNINLMSGRDIYIAANDNVNIVGNKAVNIGGTAINMASANIIGDGYPGEVGIGGIHLIATEYNYNNDELIAGSSSTVDIDGNGIILASKNGITIKSGAGIDIKASNNEAVSAVLIDRERGIYIGSDKKLVLFSGATTDEALLDENNLLQTDEYGNLLWKATGANVELSPEHLLLGVSDVGSNSATAIEMTKELIILAAGGSLNSITSNSNITEVDSVSGIQIKKDYIGMATGTLGNANNPRSIISLIPGKIVLGQISSISNGGAAAEDYTGSYVWLSKGEVYIGSVGTNGSLTDTGNFTLNTNNIKILTKLMRPEAGNARAAANIQLPLVTTMGFCLGKNLLGNPLDSNVDNRPNPAFGFWMDLDNGAHLYVNATDIRLNGDPVSSYATILSDVPVETRALYKLHNKKAAENAPTISNYTWGSKRNTSFTNDGWTVNLPSPTNYDLIDSNNTGRYVWKIIESKYKNGNSYLYAATSPSYLGLLDNLSLITYKEYKYVAADSNGTYTAPAADSNGWSLYIPKNENLYSTRYTYNDNICTKKNNITTSSATLDLTSSSNAGENDYDIRLITADTRKIKFYRYNNTSTSWEVVTDTLVKKMWLIWLNNRWLEPEYTILQIKVASSLLYSRIHIIKNDGSHIYKDVLAELELSLVSEAARNALNIASGAIPVSFVLSSGLTIDGNNVLLGSTGKLMLLGNAEVFIGSSSSNSAVVLNKDGISIGSGADIGIAANGSITVASGGSISINSGSTININSTNFKVNSAATNNNDIFYVGDSSGNIKYTKKSDGNTLTIKGSITATSGTIGGWSIGSTFLADSSDLEQATVALRKASGGKVVFFAGHTAGNDNYKSASNFSVMDTGEVTIKSTLTIGSTASGNNGYLTYTTTNGLKIKGNIEATSGEIGGWTLAGKLLSSGGTTNNKYVGLSSDTSNSSPYAIWAGHVTASSAKFRVKRNGDVYLNSLMVYDPNSQITSSSDLRDGDYARVDFSLLNFNQAISVSLNWSGGSNTLAVTATANMWGKFSGSASDSATLSVSNCEMTAHSGDGIGTGTVAGTMGGQVIALQGVTISAQRAYNAGWAKAVSTLSNATGTSLSPGQSVTISVPSSTVGSSRSFTIMARNEGSGGCFYKGSLVKLIDGSEIPIEKLLLGLKIKAYDEETGMFKTSEVMILQAIRNRKIEVVDIYLSSGKIITATTTHPLLTKKGWKALDILGAKKEHKVDVTLLLIGDELCSDTEEKIYINNIINREDLSKETVYNLNVEPYDTFIVEDIIVHNADDVPK